jgi:hypothetical protein
MYPPPENVLSKYEKNELFHAISSNGLSVNRFRASVASRSSLTIFAPATLIRHPISGSFCGIRIVGKDSTSKVSKTRHLLALSKTRYSIKYRRSRITYRTHTSCQMSKCRAWKLRYADRAATPDRPVAVSRMRIDYLPDLKS